MSIKLDQIVHHLPQSDIEYPLDQWDPPDCGLSGFRIDKEGQWYFQDGRIERQPMVRLFSKLLKKENDRYFVVSPQEKIAVEVEHHPFCVLLVDYDASNKRWSLSLNTGDSIALNQQHPLSLDPPDDRGNRLPKILVGRELYAGFQRSAYYHLVDQAEQRKVDGELVWGVSSLNGFYPLESKDD